MKPKAILQSSVNAIPFRLRHWVRHIPVANAFQRWLVNRFLGGTSFLHTINAGPAAGLRFEITLPADKAIWAGMYEPAFALAIASGVRTGDVCYDIGGYRGYMSGTMALAGASKVFAFEPLPANQRALQRLNELNSRLPIQIVPIAVGNIDGRVALRVMPDKSMGKLSTSTFQTERQSECEIEVEIRRLDSLVGSIDPPQLMKIDVEGAELEVLQGAANLMRIHRPLIFLEVHSSALERACISELAAHGYSIGYLGHSVPSAETRHLVATPATPG